MGDTKSTFSATPLNTEQCDLGQIKRIGRRGAVWVTLTSAVAMPLAYYRNWILGRFGSDGDVVGQFALILLFIQIVTTFVLFGGTTVTTNYLPKIRGDKDKSAFIFTYTILSFVVCVLFVCLLQLYPNLLVYLLKKPVDSSTLSIFSVLAPVVVLAQMVTYALVGLTEFRLSSLLEQLQLLLVCCISTIAFLLFQKFFITNALAALAATVCVASTLVILFGGYRLYKRLSCCSCRLFLPVGFWRFSSFVHLNTLLTFAYVSIDQLFILSSLGVKELGAYFIFLQCAQLIGFVPGRIGQVMLASFSQLVATDNIDALRSAYVRLCRIILIFSAPLALFVILFSHPIAGLFGEWYADRHLYLLLLAVGSSIGALGGVNSMLIMSKEQTGYFLFNSIVLIGLQFIVTFFLIKDFGVYAVIAGKIIGIISGQVGLFFIIKSKLNGVNFTVPLEFVIFSLMVIGTAVILSIVGPPKFIEAVALYSILLIIFFVLIRFRLKEVTELFRS